MKILVAYETAHGSTVGVAEKIAETLREQGAEVDVARCRELKTLGDYDAFIIGAPVWGGNWLKPAQEFLRRFGQKLAEHPVAYFHTSGAAGIDDQRETVVRGMLNALPKYAPAITPVSVGAFGGVIDFSNYNIAMRLIMKAVVGSQGGPTTGRHDMRDWDEISAWAREVWEKFADGPAG